LIPEYKLLERWSEAKAATQPFHTIARWYKVSPLVAARRALDLELITRAEFFRFYEKDREEWQKRKAEQKSKGGGGDFYRTQDARLGRRFAGILVRAVREGRVQYTDAFSLTDLKGRTFNQYAELVLARMKNERQ
jgi:Zn-dependent peptidase ImmA (M78 family)